MSAAASAPPAVRVGQVLRAFLPEYLRAHAGPAHALKILRRLAACRTGDLGYTFWHCGQCQRSHWTPTPCGDRHCPSCQQARAHAWLEKQRLALLPVRYFHWVFTLPAPLRPLALQNPAPIYALLFQAASATLLQFGQERFGAVLGITAILHTWGQNLMNHPHLHCLVTGGGLTAQNTWAGPKQARWLFDVHAVGAMFRGKFCAGLLKLHATGQRQFHGKLESLREAQAFAQFLRSLREKKWNVFARGSVVGADAVLNYLGRYTHRVALADGRVQALDASAQTVTFTYKDYAQGNRIKPMTLTGEEFVRRFSLHLLPARFTKIRHYGLLGNNARKKLIPRARTALEHSPWRFAPKAAQAKPMSELQQGIACPFCQSRQLRALARINGRGGIVWSRVPTGRTWPLALLDTS
jgi:hypothetical protein